jgi:REP element-mobilizing transposase RayT
MAGTYASIFVHVVFSTKGRTASISPEMKQRLIPYFGGIGAKNGFKVLAAGGTSDHTHLLLLLPPAIPVAKAVQLLKGGSSRWVSEMFPQSRAFEWQQGYGAFSVSVSGLDDTRRYIDSQEQHHSRVSFEDEMRAFLKRHDVEYDERYLFG